MLHQISRAGFLKYIPLVLAALLFLQVAALAQGDNGRISGTVKDQDGAIVPGATVTVKNDRTGEERTATTNTEGTFSVTALKASTYTVTATTTGLGTKVLAVEVNVGQETNLNLTMKIVDLTASINIVTGEDVVSSTGTAAMGASVNPREVKGLPLNGRQLSQLYMQAAGSVNSGSGTYGDIRFSGRAVDQNEIRYDGIEGSAIIDAAPGDTINFDTGIFATTQTITLTSGELVIDKDLTITGPGASLLTISGNDASRVFFINPGAPGATTGPPASMPVVSISNLTIANGNAKGGNGGGSSTGGCCGGGGGGGAGAGMGGGLFINNGALTISGVSFSQNKAIGGAGSINNTSAAGAGGGGGGVRRLG